LTGRRRIAELCAPIDPKEFFGFLLACGFSEEGYFEYNRHLNLDRDKPLGLITEFCETVCERPSYFKPNPDVDIERSLDLIKNCGVENIEFLNAILSAFGRALVNDHWFKNPSMGENFDKFSDEQIATFISYRKFRALPYFVFGDSHSRLYQHLRILPGGFWSLPLKITFSAASARGLGNPKSHLQNASRICSIFERIEPFIRSERIRSFIKFGQVDLEYVYPFKRIATQKNDFEYCDFLSFCETSVSKYFEFLKKVFPEDIRDLITICSVCPPVLADEEWPEGYVMGNFGGRISIERAREEINRASQIKNPDISQRTWLHREFSCRLEKEACLGGFDYLDDAVPFLRSDGMCVDEKYTRLSKGKDTHLDRGTPTLKIMDQIILAEVSKSNEAA